MGLLTNLLTLLLLLVPLSLGVLYWFFKRKYKYWDERGVAHTNPRFPFGDANEMNTSKSVGEVFRDVYEQFRGERFCGMWIMHKPVLLIRDPELAKAVLVKDFMNFQDRGSYINEKEDPLAANLVSLKGQHWRNLRAKLTPTFTSGKMKMMFPTMAECGDVLLEVLQGPAERGEVINIKEIVARFGTDVISSVAFGIQTNSLRNPHAEFREMGRKIFAPTFSNTLRNILSFLLPDVAALFKIVVTPRDVSKFFLRVFKESVGFREEKNLHRNDFLQLLIQLKNQGHLENVDYDDKEYASKDSSKFTLEEAAAQAFIFFVGGFETSSTVTQFTLYELALHPDIQTSVREEVVRVMEQHGGKLTYEGIQEMNYLQRVIDEILRMYPPGALIVRECTKDYQIPGSNVTVDKKTMVVIPVYGFHLDDNYFPDPRKFDPDRFLDSNKASTHNFTYLPFGEGPRVCIGGQRFAWLQTKVALAALLSKFEFHVTKDTPIPIVLNPKAFIFDPKGPLNLKIITNKR